MPPYSSNLQLEKSWPASKKAIKKKKKSTAKF